MPFTLSTLQLTLAEPAPYRQWAVLGLLFLIAAGFAIMNLVLSAIMGPSRKGKTKDAPYESGMDPVGDTQRRFNVRFYLVAMIFLVFDVEVLFFIPWVTIFPRYKDLAAYMPASATFLMLFAAVIAFTAIILLAYIYAWAKGVFKWD